MTTVLTRRQALATAAALPMLAALPGAAPAATPLQGASMPLHRRFRLGEFEVTTLLAGTRTVPDPQQTFGLNASAADFAAAAAGALIPTDRSQFFFTPTLVNTGTELVLFDTGLNPEGITAALAAAGIAPEQVTLVVLTHMHGDHIGGLAGATGPTFANARYATGALEHNHWSAAGNEGFDRLVKPLNDRMVFLDDGGAAAPGVTATLAAGHTPGHMVWRLDSAGQQLIITADLANHFVFSLEHPDWEVRFDMDKPAAAASRRRILGELAADRIPFIGYHMPFPALGYVAVRGEGFRHVPHSYQLLLD